MIDWGPAVSPRHGRRVPGHVLGGLLAALLAVVGWGPALAADTGETGWVLGPDAPDISVALHILTSANICYVDSDGSGGYAAGEPVVLDVSGSCSGSVSGQDLRLNSWGDELGGRRVLGGAERGSTLSSPGAAKIYFYDADGNGQLSPGDTAYANVHIPSSATVTVGDVRLSPYGDRPAFSIVRGADPDTALGVTLLGDADEEAGYVDADGDRNLGANEIVYVRAEDRTDDLVGTGDLRLVDIDALRPAGSFVEPGDGDGSFLLTALDAPVCFVDEDASGGYTAGEPIYSDRGSDCAGSVSKSDVRLSAGDGGAPGTRVATGDSDVGLDLDPITAATLAYTDADGDGSFTLGDSLYLDLVAPGELRLQAGDLRISPYVGVGGGFVAGDSPDLGGALTRLGAFEDHFAFASGAGSTKPSATDPLYVDVDPDSGSGVAVGDVRLVILGARPYGGSASLASGEVLTPIRSGSAAACFVLESASYSAGDPTYLAVSGGCTEVAVGMVRLAGVDDDTVGTLVAAGDPEIGADLDPNPDAPELRFVDSDGDGEWSLGDALYLDIRDQSGLRVSVGDVRLSRYADLSARDVRTGDDDLDLTLLALGTVSGLVDYVDADGSGSFGPGDVPYVNADNTGSYTTVLDVRLARLPDAPAAWTPPVSGDATTTTSPTGGDGETAPTETGTSTGEPTGTGEQTSTGVRTPALGPLGALLAFALLAAGRRRAA